MAKKKLDYMPYPEYVSLRVGMKVSWYLYGSKKEAEKAAEAAKHNAAIQESLGYDFGYQSPGSISKVEGGFEVVIP